MNYIVTTMCFVLVIRPVLRPKGYERQRGPISRFRMKVWSWLHRNHPRPVAIAACREAFSPTTSPLICDPKDIEDGAEPPPYNPTIKFVDDEDETQEAV